MLPDLDRLKVFYYIFQDKSIVSAAKTLHITQSAVSQSLAKLEAELKTPLFIRLHKRIAPTNAADKLFSIVKPFMDELEMGLKDLECAREKPFGQIRIGVPEVFGKTYLPEILTSFRNKYPEVTFYLKLGYPAAILPMIEKGELNFGFLDELMIRKPFFGDMGLYAMEPVLEEEVILACSGDYYEMNIKGDHSFENIVSAEFISYQPNAMTIRNWFIYHFKKKPLKLNIVITVDSPRSVIEAVKNGGGAAVIHSHLIYDEIISGDIVPISTHKPEIINRMFFVELQNKIPGLTEKTFKSFCLDKIHKMGFETKFKKLSKNNKK